MSDIGDDVSATEYMLSVCGFTNSPDDPFKGKPPGTRIVAPVTFSAMGDDGRFTVLLREDVVRDLAHVRNTIDCPSQLVAAARNALAAHDSDTAKEEWIDKALETWGLMDYEPMRGMCAELYEQHPALIASRDLAKGTEPTDG